MNYTELVKKYAEVSGRTAVESKEICNQMLGLVMDTFMRGEGIDIYGFGKLEVIESKAREAKAPDGKVYPVPPKRRLQFKNSKAFVERLSEGL